MTIGNTFGSLAGDRRGNVAVTFAVLMPLIIGTAGVAVDNAVWQMQRQKLQSVTDQAALSGAAAFEDMSYPTTTARLAAAGNAAKGFVMATRPELTPDVVIDVAARSVKVTLTDRGLVGFAGIFGLERIDLSTASKAIADRDMGAVCLLALDEAAPTGIAFSGTGTIATTGCSVWSNASSKRSITIAGRVEVKAERMCSAGETVVGSGAAVTGATKKRCAGLSDPLATWAPAVPAGCTKTNLKLTASGDLTLWPGTYCGGLEAVAKGSITLMPGEYHVKGGDLRLLAERSIQGDDVGLYLSGGRGVADIAGQGGVRLSARTVGDLKGKVLAGERGSVTGLASRMAAGTSLDIAGTIYLPNQALSYTGASGGQPVTQLIAGTLAIGATNAMTFKADFDAMKVPRIASLLPNLRLAE